MLHKTGSPLESKLAFDAWIAWACYSICDWPPNMFYGIAAKSVREDGIQVSTPSTPDFAAEQLLRVEEASKRLEARLGGPSKPHTPFIGEFPARATLASQNAKRVRSDSETLETSEREFRKRSKACQLPCFNNAQSAIALPLEASLTL